MADTLRVTFDANDTLDLLAKFPDRLFKGASRAINRAVKSARTYMVRAIAGETGLKSGDVRDAMRLQLATPSNLSGELAVGLKRIPLIQFKAREVGVSGRKGYGGGVAYMLGGGMRVVPNAFIATMGSGHTGVFKRKGKARLPIQELYGPSLGKVFEKFRPQGLARASEMLEKNMDRELAFAAIGVDVTVDDTADGADDAE